MVILLTFFLSHQHTTPRLPPRDISYVHSWCWWSGDYCCGWPLSHPQRKCASPACTSNDLMRFVLFICSIHTATQAGAVCANRHVRIQPNCGDRLSRQIVTSCAIQTLVSTSLKELEPWHIWVLLSNHTSPLSSVSVIKCIGLIWHFFSSLYYPLCLIILLYYAFVIYLWPQYELHCYNTCIMNVNRWGYDVGCLP